MVEPGAPGQRPASSRREGAQGIPKGKGIPKGQGIPADQGRPRGASPLPGEGLLPGEGILPGAPGQVHRGTDGQMDRDAPNPWAPQAPCAATECEAHGPTDTEAAEGP